MYGAFILPENTDESITEKFLDNTREFLTKSLGEDVSENIGPVLTIDERFIREYADSFGYELREIGTRGLSQKYIGRLYISVYNSSDGGLPHWVIDGICAVTHAQFIEYKRKDNDY